MKTFKLLLPTFIIYCVACKSDQKVAYVNYNDQLKQLKKASVTLCDISTVEWDTLWVLPPYATIETLSETSLKDVNAIKHQIERGGVDDSEFQLVLAKDNSIVEIGDIPRNILNLSSPRKTDGSLHLFTKKDCKNALITREQK